MQNTISGITQLITLKHFHSYDHWSISRRSEYHNFWQFRQLLWHRCQNWSILDSSRCGKPSMHISLIRYRSFETSYVKGWKVLNDFSKLHPCLIYNLKLALTKENVAESDKRWIFFCIEHVRIENLTQKSKYAFDLFFVEEILVLSRLSTTEETIESRVD